MSCLVKVSNDVWNSLPPMFKRKYLFKDKGIDGDNDDDIIADDVVWWWLVFDPNEIVVCNLFKWSPVLNYYLLVMGFVFLTAFVKNAD